MLQSSSIRWPFLFRGITGLSFIFAMLVFKKGEFNLNVTNSAPIWAKENGIKFSQSIQYIARSASCVSIEKFALISSGHDTNKARYNLPG